MEILVCVRRVPDTSENEIELNAEGNGIERDELVYSVNEADNYAVEEALQIRDRVGGSVTVVTVGGEDDEERGLHARGGRDRRRCSELYRVRVPEAHLSRARQRAERGLSEGASVV